MKWWDVLFAFVVLGRYDDAAYSHHLPLISGALLTGLQSIQISYCCMSGSYVKTEEIRHINHPFHHHSPMLTRR
jgi:hypothetical protein